MFRTMYGPHVKVSLSDFDPSMTQQSMLEECDINNIIARIMRGDLTAPVNRFEPRYGDYADYEADYHEAMNLVLEAQASFDKLPAKMRDRFHNDPAALLKFLENPDNRDEAISLGIIDAPPPSVAPASGAGAAISEPAATTPAAGTA